MKSFSRLLALVATMIIVIWTSPGHAASRTFIASTGNDANVCYAPESPCKTFNGAQAKMDSGGLITCLDPMDLAAVGFTKSITLSCEGSTIGELYNNTTDAIDMIVYGASMMFVDFNNAGSLILDRVRIGGSPPQTDVTFRPRGAAKLMISNSILTGGGNISSQTGANIQVIPQPGGTAQVSLANVRVEGGIFGLAFDGTNSTGGINATIADSMISGNGLDGIVATSSPGHAPIGVMVTNTKSVNNAYGIRSIGPNVTVRVENSKIVGNGTGLSAFSDGALLSAQNNFVQANGSNGSFTGSISPQ